MSDLKSLYDLYVDADAAVETAKLAVDTAMVARSNAVRAIADAVAPKKKVIRNGKELTIVVRGENYFFRGGNAKDDAVEI